jgi:hypothetical protein
LTKRGWRGPLSGRSDKEWGIYRADRLRGAGIRRLGASTRRGVPFALSVGDGGNGEYAHILAVILVHQGLRGQVAAHNQGKHDEQHNEGLAHCPDCRCDLRRETRGRTLGPPPRDALTADLLAQVALGVPTGAADLVVRLDVVAQRAARLIVVPVGTRQLGMERRNLQRFPPCCGFLWAAPGATGLRQTTLHNKDERLTGRSGRGGRSCLAGAALLVAGGGSGCYLGRLLPLSGGQRYLACPNERLTQPGKDHEVGVQPHAVDATDADRCEAVIVLQPAELALNGGALPVEALGLVRPVCDREQRDRATLAEADDGDAAALGFFTDALVVV